MIEGLSIVGDHHAMSARAKSTGRRDAVAPKARIGSTTDPSAASGRKEVR